MSEAKTNAPKPRMSNKPSAPKPQAPTGSAVIVANVLNLNLPENVRTTEIGGIVADNADSQRQQIRGYIRSRVLKQYDIVEAFKVAVNAGKFAVNDLVTALKLPKVKIDESGMFAEDLMTYYTRCIPAINLWLRKSFYNANITAENIGAIAPEVAAAETAPPASATEQPAETVA